MPVYSKERPELELESFFRSLYPSTRRKIRENWIRLRETPEIFKEEIEEEIEEDLRKDEEGNFWMDDIDKWDSLYPEEAKERRKRFWRKLGLKE